MQNIFLNSLKLTSRSLAIILCCLTLVACGHSGSNADDLSTDNNPEGESNDSNDSSDSSDTSDENMQFTTDNNSNGPCAGIESDDDLDGDGNPDVCDADIDGDEFANVDDNCPNDANPDQGDANSNSIGDVCDLSNDVAPENTFSIIGEWTECKEYDIYSNYGLAVVPTIRTNMTFFEDGKLTQTRDMFNSKDCSGPRRSQVYNFTENKWRSGDEFTNAEGVVVREFDMGHQLMGLGVQYLHMVYHIEMDNEGELLYLPYETSGMSMGFSPLNRITSLEKAGLFRRK